MTNIFSAISGQFSKSLILGTFLPVTVFVILAWLFVIPLFPSELTQPKLLETFDNQLRALITLLFITILLSGLLYNLNIPIISFYEGYPWEHLWIGEKRKNRFKRRFRIIQSQWKGLARLKYERGELFKQQGVAADEVLLNQIEDRISIVGRELATEFPGEERLVLPTRLGNVIRSFEYYPDHQYGMEAVTLWPRLAAKIDKEYAAAIDEAKTSFDFMLNSSLLSSMLTFALLITGLLSLSPFVSWRATIYWVVELVVFGLLAYLFYFISIGRARAWGNTIRSAFDLYRWDLLKQLGYKYSAMAREEERALWRNISGQIIFGDTYLIAPFDYYRPDTFARVEPDNVTVEVGRGVYHSGKDDQITVVIRVKNNSRYAAESIEVIDTLPTGYHYRWNSHSLHNPSDPAHAVETKGSNPFRFMVGSLAPNAELVLRYRAVVLKKEA
ncbi:MAG: DUF11 domain-containing protein [Pyrinomonadaceae bacterium]|nr:DUF11 domain-containing protein [Pyrinomonadaceae bacterium]